MGTCHTIYYWTGGLHEEDPQVSNHHPHNKKFDWRRAVKILDGANPVTRDWQRVINGLDEVRSILAPFDFRASNKKQLAISDVVYFPLETDLAISGRARQVIDAMHIPGLEYIDVVIEGQIWHLLLMGNIIDCFDRERGTYTVYENHPNRIRDFEKFEFRKDIIPNPSIFRIPYTVSNFATDGVKDAFERAGLRGFEFREIEGRSVWEAAGLTNK